MPIIHAVDHQRRLVVARWEGTVVAEDLFAYQQEAWSRPDVAGYNELINMLDVKELPDTGPLAPVLESLANVSAKMDPAGTSSRLAIVAPNALVFGLGRMYQAFRSISPGSNKEVGVFRTLAEARAFLGVDDIPG